MKRPPTFVLVCDEMLTAAHCRSLISAFENSQHKVPGKIGGREDPKSKDSLDLGLDALHGVQVQRDALRQALDRALLEYLRQYPDLLWGTHQIQVQSPHGQLTLSREDFSGLSDPAKLRIIQQSLVCDRWQIQKYKKGEGNFNRWHSEIYPPWLAPQDLDSKFSPLTRVLFVLLYLNEVEQGGTTDLLYQRMSIPPKSGRMLLAPAGFSHTHRGTVPQSGDKYVLTSWVCWAEEHVQIDLA